MVPSRRIGAVRISLGLRVMFILEPHRCRAIGQHAMESWARPNRSCVASEPLYQKRPIAWKLKAIGVGPYTFLRKRINCVSGRRPQRKVAQTVFRAAGSPSPGRMWTKLAGVVSQESRKLLLTIYREDRKVAGGPARISSLPCGKTLTGHAEFLLRSGLDLLPPGPRVRKS